MDLKEQIVNCNSLEDLLSIKQSVNHLPYQGQTNYDKQNYLNKIDNLQKLIEIKRNVLSETKFKFVGEPVRNNIKSAVTTIPTFTVQPPFKKGVTREKIIINDMISHLLIEDFMHCIIMNDNNSNSINLINGKYSIIELTINGTIILNHLENCRLKLKCHQLRIHNCNNLVIDIDVEDNINNYSIILEDCHNLKFSQDVKINDFNSALTVSNNYEIIKHDDYNCLQWINNCHDKLSDNDVTLINKCTNA